jgi:hypothetical protein
MKTAGRENPNRRATVPDDRAHGATGQEQIPLNQVGCEARKIAAVGEICFLTSTFIDQGLSLKKISSRWPQKPRSTCGSTG